MAMGGLVWHGPPGLGGVRHGRDLTARHDMARRGFGLVRPGGAGTPWQGVLWQCLLWQGWAGPGEELVAGYGVARHC